jgi:hypothetical protein
MQAFLLALAAKLVMLCHHERRCSVGTGLSDGTTLIETVQPIIRSTERELYTRSSLCLVVRRPNGATQSGRITLERVNASVMHESSASEIKWKINLKGSILRKFLDRQDSTMTHISFALCSRSFRNLIDSQRHSKPKNAFCAVH